MAYYFYFLADFKGLRAWKKRSKTNKKLKRDTNPPSTCSQQNEEHQHKKNIPYSRPRPFLAKASTTVLPSLRMCRKETCIYYWILSRIASAICLYGWSLLHPSFINLTTSEEFKWVSIRPKPHSIAKCIPCKIVDNYAKRIVHFPSYK